MAKPKPKYLYPDLNEQIHSSCSNNSSSESERSLQTINADAVKRSSEVLKRQRHYQEFKRLYYSRLKSKGKYSKHDPRGKWSDAVDISKRDDDSAHKMLPLKMTASKVSHRRSDRNYLMEKMYNQFQKPSTSRKHSSESLKVMYSASVGGERKKDREHSHNRHYKLESRVEQGKRHEDKRSKDDDRESNEVEKLHSSRKHRRDEVDDLEEDYLRRRRRKKDDDENDYYKHRRRHSNDNSVKIKEKYIDDERNENKYENYEKYKHEREGRHRSLDKYKDDDRHHHKRYDDIYDGKDLKYDIYNLRKYDRYRHEKDPTRHRRYDSADDKDDRHHHHTLRHRSRSSRGGRYSEEDYEMIERLERYIRQKKMGLAYYKNKYLFNRSDDIKRVPSTEHIALGYKPSQELDKRDSLELTRLREKDDHIKKKNTYESDNPTDIEDLPERDHPELSKPKSSQKLLIESQAEKREAPVGIIKTNLKPESRLKNKPVKSGSVDFGYGKKVQIKKEKLQKHESDNVKKSVTKSAEKKDRVVIKEPKKPIEEQNDSLLSTFSQMEEKAMKTLEALRDAEKIIISEKLKIGHEDLIEHEVERRLKEITDTSKRTNSKNDEINYLYNEGINESTELKNDTSYDKQFHQDLEYKILVLKLQELQHKQMSQTQNSKLEYPNKNSLKRKNSPEKPVVKNLKRRDSPDIIKYYGNYDNKVTPTSGDRSAKLKVQDIEACLSNIAKLIPNDDRLKGDGRVYKSNFIPKVVTTYKREVPTEKRIKWKGIDSEKEPDWIDVRKDDIIVNKGFDSNSSENNINWSAENSHDRKVVKCDKKINWKDIIVEEDANESSVAVNNSKQVTEEINIDDLEARKTQIVEQLRRIIDVPENKPHVKDQMGSAPSLHVSSSIRDSSKSRLPLRVDTKNSPFHRSSNSINSAVFQSVQTEIGPFSRLSGYDNEELLETLKRVVDLEAAPSPKSSYRTPPSPYQKPKQSAFQKVKKIIKGENKKKEKKQNNQAVSKRPAPKKDTKPEKAIQISSREDALRQAIDLFNIQKSTLSIVRGEIAHLEHKISSLLEKRESMIDRRSRIPRRVKK